MRKSIKGLAALALAGLVLGFAGCKTGVETSVVPVTKVTITSGNRVNIGRELTLTATVEPEDATDKTVTYKITEGSAYATLSGDKLTGVAEGTVKIKATAGGVESEEVSIAVSPVSVDSVTLEADVTSIVAGGTVTFTATVLPEDAADKTVTYEITGGSDYATLSDNVLTGKLPGVTSGTVTVKATAGGVDSNEVIITVNPKPVETVTITSGNSVNIGSELTLTATVEPEDATDKTVTYKITEGSAYATLSGDKLTGVAEGTVKIKATAGGVDSEEVSITVNKINVTSVSITASSVLVGEEITLTATVLPENASDKTVTYEITEGAEYATLNGDKLTGVAEGTVKIKATADEVESDVVSVKVVSGFVKIPAASITGSETWAPSSSVFVSGRVLEIASFYMSDHEVTEDEFTAVFGAAHSTGSNYSGTLGNTPQVYVSWYHAIIYCNKRSVQEGLTPCYTVEGVTDWENFAWGDTPGSVSEIWDAATCDFSANGYRLPTEAEWEWAARGGNDYTYAGSNTAGDVAWYGDNSSNARHEVKQKKANDYGLYDMSGNAVEYCWDFYADTLTADVAATGPTESTANTNRVYRGGAYSYFASSCTVAWRGATKPSYTGYKEGFRVVRNAE